MKHIERWSVVEITTAISGPYTAPELRTLCLAGICDGIPIRTSAIRGVTDDGTVLTRNNEYRLGEIDPAYEAAYPDARERLLSGARPR